jgi:glycosyltransferase involved in cell wall biosynthesis
MHIAFYAPLKSPDHPVPSGDRLMAQLLTQAMRHAGYTVTLASRFRSYAPSAENFEARHAAGRAEAMRLAAEWHMHGAPDLFFCYHPYYKSPDFLGPALCEEFGIPYSTAEASFSSRRSAGVWAAAQALVAKGLAKADLNICITERDRAGLEKIVEADRLAMLPAFLDVTPFSPSTGSTPPRLVTVAMMRPGDKLESYHMLAAALTLCTDLPWTLTVVGDGPCREKVRSLFAALPRDRIEWSGELPPTDVPALLAWGDIYVWPGFGEAYGLAYLEAQASGLPVVAQAVAGVPEVVRDGETGLLTAPGDIRAYADAIRRLLADSALRESMGAEARRVVVAERSLGRAAATLKSLLSRFET